MADIPLKSFTFPGLSDKYTTPVVDNTLTQTGAAADAKKTGDEIGAIKNDLSDGTMTVNKAENADQLTATVGIEDNAPYLFRTSGGSNDIGDREDVRKIVGGTIVNNQLVGAYSITGATDSIADGVVTITPLNNGNRYRANKDLNTNGIYVTNNHVYLMSVVIKSDGEHEVGFHNYATPGELNAADKTTSSAWTTLSVIRKCTNSGICYIQLASLKVSEYAIKENSFIVRDLTLDITPSIADYVYSLETATAGAGVAWLKKHFPKQFDAGYQAYDAGSLQSVSGLTAHKMTGFNQWDEETELGIYDINTGAKVENTTNIRNKNLIRILPNTQYCWNNTVSDVIRWVFFDANKEYLSYASTSHSSPYVFTTPANACYMAFYYGATSYDGTLCINFHWDGEKDGTYEPYKTWSYALDSDVVLRGIPKLDSNNNLYYDGDEYLPDGTVNRRYGLVDMGTLTWRYNETYTVFWADVPGVLPSVSSGKDNARCSKYAVVVTNENGVRDLPDKHMMANSSFAASSMCTVVVKDSAYTDATAFKTAMSGVYLVYELATPTTETTLPYQETQIVNDFGTEEFVLADGAFPVPVGHNTMYQNNLRAKLEMSPDSPDGDGLYVVQQESGENTYVPLASTATIQDILTRLTALENA